jgi:hypothetical protein
MPKKFMPNEAVNKRLFRSAMKDNEYDFAMLGVLIGRSAQSCRNYAEGTQKPDVHTALRLSRILKKPIHKLFPTE